MAIGTPTLHAVAANSNNSKTTHSTLAFTPTAGTLLVAACAARKTADGAPPPVLSVGDTFAGTLTWASITVSNAALARHTMVVNWAIVPATPGSGTVTWSSDLSCNRWEAMACSISGTATAITNSGTTVTATAASSVTLTSAPATSSVVIGFVASVGDDDGVAPAAGWTELFDSQVPIPSGGNTITTLGVVYDLPPAGNAPGFTGCIAAANGNLLIAIEIPAAPVESTFGLLRRRRLGGTGKDGRYLRR